MKRNAILGLVAALGVCAVAVDQLVIQPGKGPAAKGSPAASPPQEPVPVGAPAGADLSSLKKRYRPIRLKRPFRKRDFKDRPKRKKPKPVERSEDPTPSAPSMAVLRLTAFLGDGESRVGILEQRGTGNAVFAKSGKTVGPVTVASVGSVSITVVEAKKSRDINLGDSLEVPLLAVPSLVEPLQPSGSTRSGSSKATPGLPQISEKKKMTILERLKARRRASLERSKKKAAEGAKQAPEAGKSEAPKKDEK
jgi:hypothetical protein